MIDYQRIPSPAFVLDEARLICNLELIGRVQKEANVEIILAFKGFAMWGVFDIVKRYLTGATASSLHEVRLCEEYMKTPAHTYLVAYPDHEFDEIAQRSSHLTFNSLNQWERFRHRIPKGVRCALRINPEWSDVSTQLYNPASSQSRLGITAEHLQSGLPEGIDGLHLHVLCESDSYAMEQVLLAVEQRFGHLLDRISWLNLGGGHLMTRKDYDEGHLIRLLSEFREKHNLHLILEPGSAIAWQTGDLRAKVLDITENGGTKTAIVDVSFTCHMPDCLEMPYRPVITGAHMDPAFGAHAYRIGGLSCLAGDFMEEYGFDAPLSPGDDIIFEDMMHYTMVKTTTFNGVPHPAIGVWRDSEFVMLREFGYDDYKGRLG